MLLDWALAYAEAGYSVFPLVDRGKRPRTKHGQHDATTDAKKVEDWWKRWPKANIGLFLEPSGLMAIDVDPRNGGDVATLPFAEELEGACEQRTGSGGAHILYHVPDGWSPPGQLTKGIDLKHKGYIVVEPSVHPDTGERYAWCQGRGLLEVEPGELPPAVQTFADQGKKQEVVHFANSEDKIGEGDRHRYLLGQAASMAARGMSAEAIVAALRTENETRCEPPYDDAAVVRMAKDMAAKPVDEQTTALSLVKNHVAGLELSAEGIPTRPARLDDYAEEKLRLLNDAGNAARFYHAHKNDLIYVNEIKAWMRFVGPHWEEVSYVYKEVIENAELLHQMAQAEPEEEAQKRIQKFARRSQNAHAIDSSIKLSRESFSVSVNDLDRHPLLFNAANGTVHLKTGKMTSGDPTHLISQVASTKFNPEAECPRWDAFLKQVQPDPIIRAYLQRVIGYAVTGLTTEHCLFIFHGSGANGKSVFLDTIFGLLGSYAKTIRPEALLFDGKNSIPSDIARLKGARFVHASETEIGARLAEGVVKTVTGDKTIMARRMYSDWFEYEPTYTLFLATNHEPTIKGTEDGIWRRIKLVPWKITVAPSMRKQGLTDTLLEKEAEGILNWCIEGAKNYFGLGLLEPQSVTIATERYKNEMDPINAFLEEACDVGTDYRTSVTELYQLYARWATESGLRSMSKISLGRAMSERGYTNFVTGGQRVWLGVRERGLLNVRSPF